MLAIVLLPTPVLAQPTTSCRPNIFGGQDCDTPVGPITSQPNIFGGQDYQLPDGRRVTSQPNIFGGYDYEGGKGLPLPPDSGNTRERSGAGD